MVTLSSTESEWVVLCEATALAEWFKGVMLQLGIKLQPILIRQDNTSSIWLATNGGNFARTKHLLIKRNKAKERTLLGITKVNYCPTEQMLADIGTKILGARDLLNHMDALGMQMIKRNGDRYTTSRIAVPAKRVATNNRANSQRAPITSNKDK